MTLGTIGTHHHHSSAITMPPTAIHATAVEHPAVTLPSKFLPERPANPTAFFYFDIDGTVYSHSRGVLDEMRDLIETYFARHLNLSRDEAIRLHKQYYSQYGLSVRGLLKHHSADPVDYDRNVDQALNLPKYVHSDPELRAMLQRLRPDIVRWTFTNAGVHHARRVLDLVGISDVFHGMTYCDYTRPNFSCKPEPEFYEQAMAESAYARAGVPIYFADDNLPNLTAAKKRGWTTIWVDVERRSHADADFTIADLKELPSILPHLFV
ncbi:putative suppressor of disruption of TFIIS [Blastocladiella emersonii ATCC 22665]|nr:putative suppressor of disruption of TFIIS [Blastocladiella emersonii ATCC 22665]